MHGTATISDSLVRALIITPLSCKKGRQSHSSSEHDSTHPHVAWTGMDIDAVTISNLHNGGQMSGTLLLGYHADLHDTRQEQWIVSTAAKHEEHSGDRACLHTCLPDCPQSFVWPCNPTKNLTGPAPAHAGDALPAVLCHHQAVTSRRIL